MDTGAQLVEALLYGKLEGLSPETIFLYSRTGLIHLFSASGFHMGAAVAMAMLASRVLGRPLPARFRKFLLFFLSLSLMTLFGAKTAWSSPLVRSYAFTTLLLGARLLETRPSKLRVFLLSLLAALIFGRGSMLSFLLSALGMAGILWGSGRNFFSMALGPWLFTLPVVIWVFGLFSLAAPLWNLTYAPLVSLTVLPLAILDLSLTSLGIPWRGCFQLAAWLMERFHTLLAAGDFGLAFWVEPKSFVLVSLALLLAFHLPRPRWWIGGICLLALFLPRPKLAALDVGQGDGIFLRLANGETMVVDGGPPGFMGRDARVNRSLEKIGEGRIDHLLLTHPDQDHLGGLPSLLTRHQAGTLWIREIGLADKRLFPLIAAAERVDLPIRFLEHGSPPGLDCRLPPFREGNESSPFCFARLRGGKSIWLTGDAGFRAENWLQTQSFPKADFLKIGHHGSKFSSGLDFLKATGARTALISVGRKNHYGHPAPPTLARLREAGMETRRTDQEGTIAFY